MDALEGRIFPLRICSIDVNFREIYMKVPAVIDCHMTKWASPPNSLGTLEILISLSVCLLVDFQIIILPFDKCGQRHNLSYIAVAHQVLQFSLQNTIRAGLDESVGRKEFYN